MRVIFFGTPDFAARFLDALVGDPALTIAAVVTQPDEPVGRKGVLTPPPLKMRALAQGIPVLQPEKMKDPTFQDALRAHNADCFVVIAFGRILPQSLLDIPRLGCVNVHPSLLPKLRGPSPIISAIAAGERETGVSIMLLDGEMDHGPILSQVAFPLAANETTATLTEKVVAYGAPLLIDTLHTYGEGHIRPESQQHEHATFCRLLSREDGRIDWQTEAECIERMVRAYHPWPGTWTLWKQGSKKIALKVFRVALTNEQHAPGMVHVQDNRLIVGSKTVGLEILELQPAGGTRMDAASFLRGHRDIDGATLGKQLPPE